MLAQLPWPNPESATGLVSHILNTKLHLLERLIIIIIIIILSNSSTVNIAISAAASQTGKNRHYNHTHSHLTLVRTPPTYMKLHAHKSTTWYCETPTPPALSRHPVPGATPVPRAANRMVCPHATRAGRPAGRPRNVYWETGSGPPQQTHGR